MAAVAADIDNAKTMNSQEYIEMEAQYGAHNYHPIPVVITKGNGIYVWDVEGKEYMDFLSAYTALSQGHCHPRILNALVKQCSELTLTSRAFHSDKLGPFCKYVCELFGYDKVLPMNSGVEAGETAIKLCRKWAYVKKGVQENKARIIFAENNFWGRTIAACSISSDPSCFKDFGPFLPGFERIPYNNLKALEDMIKADTENTLAGFYIEPIQGEAGIIVPDEGYLKKAYDMCKAHNMLFIADEIQAGLCRTGKLLCCDHDQVKPDMVCLGKALSGGVLPVSAVLANNEVMLCLKPGEHGSTYGGNPLACAVAMEALKVLIEEDLASNAEKMGKLFRDKMTEMQQRYSFIECVRGKGLLNAVVIKQNFKMSAWDICLKLRDGAVLCKPTHDYIIRFAPPLIIKESQMNEALKRIDQVFAAIASSE